MRCIGSFLTRRLAAERVRFRHYDRWLALFRNPHVLAFEGGAWSVDRIAKGFARQLGRWDIAGLGYWVFTDRSGRFVGTGGVRDLPRAGPLAVELGYAVMPEFWGRGLATEMGRAILETGVEDLGSGDVIAFTHLTHAASRRVLEKLGFKFEGNPGRRARRRRSIAGGPDPALDSLERRGLYSAFATGG